MGSDDSASKSTAQVFDCGKFFSVEIAVGSFVVVGESCGREFMSRIAEGDPDYLLPG